MAVYTDVSDEDIARFVAEYDIGEVVSFKGIAEGVENTNFLLQTSIAPFILTLYEKRVNPDDLPFYLGLMDHLSGKGLNCPTPIHGKDGAALRTLCDRPAAITSFLRGMSPRRIQPHHCAGVGAALAQLHSAGLDFEMHLPNALSVAGWRSLFESCQEHANDEVPGLGDMIGEELDYLEANWPHELPKGVIHADLFPDNVFFFPGKEEVSGLIDFYFACNDLLCYDVAICMNAWCFEPDNSFNVTKAKNLLSHYSKVRPISDAEKAALPILARGASLRFLLTRLYDWVNTPKDALVTPKNPREYINKLRFHQRVDNASAYGLD
ncbi:MULTISPECIES: homoserine kinase [Thalassospira]|jgi:homoserine kinase type II|uniref:Homoserine kinase n=1 Tax=Thalassospira profundimaris TaxID=502049 RepID=A0A367VLC2_9PROT|nr:MULTISPECIES: homoserine kinase [Thalassospira]HAI28850.1 homoserine kinase [Thalassospira sp.]KZB71116.1 homoserine kinase [Thalassospira sp. MCCC 1A01148]MBS8273300.1 homoserine kinase [Thalassospira tepidiphila]RCK25231.1 serine kinase [Thalassospira profundimaris]HCK18808.1 homoserine kinase [Thalassospira sp.]|tara:strand:- start:2717 stop:3685 length:969 start_codon:yes stop_codon:yes gene_type:complete